MMELFEKMFEKRREWGWGRSAWGWVVRTGAGGSSFDPVALPAL